MSVRSSAQASEARRAAARVAADAHVRVASARDLEGLATAAAVVDEVWRPRPEDRPISVGLLRAMTHVGNYCSIAYAEGRPVGVCIGFFGLEGELTLHSHITGVVPGHAGRHVGRALKLDQRAWALEHGVGTITWTYDPLIRRNAYFNVRRLGALPVGYLADFYGDMTDSINVGQHTDRLVVEWPLQSERVVRLSRGDTADELGGHAMPAAILLDVDADNGGPMRRPVEEAGTALVQIPEDIEQLRARDPGLAREWRLAVRDVLGSRLSTGWRVVDVTPSGYYLLHREKELSA